MRKPKVIENSVMTVTQEKLYLTRLRPIEIKISFTRVTWPWGLQHV